LDDSATDSPPVGAPLEIVTVPVVEVPPITELGFSTTELTVGPLTVIVDVCWEPFADAVIVTDWLVATATVVAVKVAEVAPAATLTEAGTVTAALLDARATGSPPVGAAELIVTVPVELVPPTTVDGLMATETTVGPLIVRSAD